MDLLDVVKDTSEDLRGQGQGHSEDEQRRGRSLRPRTEKEESRRRPGWGAPPQGATVRKDVLIQPGLQHKRKVRDHLTLSVLMRKVLRGAEMHCILTGVKM